MTDTAKRLLGDFWDLVLDNSSRSTEIKAGRRIPARSGGNAEIDRRLSHLRASEQWRAGARSAGGAGDIRSASAKT
jgi:hypothetical protein